MPPNPFSPPRSVVADMSFGADMRKPVRVWLVQAMALLAAGACAPTMDVLAPLVRSGRADVGLLAASSMAAGISVCARFALVGSQQRRAYVRWCGLALLASIVLPEGSTCMEWLDAMAGNAGESGLATAHIATIVAMVAVMGLALFLGWAYGVSRRCLSWFGMTAKAASG
jgi:hypothetical protein